MYHKRLVCKFSLNNWDNIKCKGCPRKSWVEQVESLKKTLDIQDKVLDVKKATEKEKEKRV